MTDRRLPIVPFDGEHLAQRLGVAAERLGAGAIDLREMDHLVGVVTRCSALLRNVYTDYRLRTILGDNPRRLAALVASPWFRLPWSEDLPGALSRLRRLPDQVREVGDQALFDVGITGRSRVRGLPLDEVGRRAYLLAADVLEHLADDARLREHFRANGFGAPLNVEDEISFLRRCADRFDLYGRLLRAAEEGGPAGDDTVTGVIVSAGGSQLLIPAPSEARPLPVRLPSGRLFDEESASRERLLAAYERLLLFASLDLDALRRGIAGEVIDQAEAIETLVDDFALFAVGTQSLTRPASYFLVGPTGVGKNHLVETLRRQLEAQWRLEIPLLTIEGPNYTYPSDINELRGATRGFIRSDEPGLLTEFHKKAESAPLSIILVDEVEKAHPQLRRFFLSILDRGTTTDAHGNELHLEGTLIFFTSNIGYREKSAITNPIGFADAAAQAAAYAAELTQDLKRELSPEFINRLKIVRFRHLPRASAQTILQLEVARISARYREVHGIELILSPAAEELLLDMGYSAEYGARHLAAYTQRYCNVEVGKMLRRDESQAKRDPAELLSQLRRAKRGETPLDLTDLDRRVLEQTRARVGYGAIVVDAEDGKIVHRRG